VHNSRLHSELSASGADRWMHCPGSVRMCGGRPSVETVFAAEGTAAHELAQAVLTEDRDADAYIGMMFGDFIVTADMASAVQIYVDTCRRVADACAFYRIEQQFDLSPLQPPVPIFGTADFIAYSSRRHGLHVVDFKYGKGVLVSTRGNAQLHYYALGASLSIDEPVSSVTMTIVQPRTSGDPVRTASTGAIELAEWSFTLLDRARATQQPDAPLVAGDWCRFCPAKACCPAYQGGRASAAYHESTLTDVTTAGT
jgi:Protein of unknown function (DUF2800)